MAKKNLNDAFDDYHRENPLVYIAFRRSAVQLMNAGHTHFGAKCIMEYIRFHTAVTGKDSFKINNNYTSRYVRLLEKERPEFIGFFAKRTISFRRQRELF